MNKKMKIALIVFASAACAAVGLGVSTAVVGGNAERSGAKVVRTRNGVVETGVVSTVTTNGLVKRVIRWRTREGNTVTQTVRGPLRLHTVSGDPIYLPGPTSTVVVQHTHTTTLPGGTLVVTGPGVTTTLPAQTTTLPGETVTLPGETVTQAETVTATETVRDTVTEVVTVTETLPPRPSRWWKR
jgi:hypothetical protein